MKEAVRALGVGFALVDEKVINPKSPLPQKVEDVDGFLSVHGEIITGAGGSITNVMSAYADFMQVGEAKLFSRIGEDSRGLVFRNETNQKLGIPQVDRTKPTGVCVFSIDLNKGEPWDEVTYYGAAESVRVPRAEVNASRNRLFIANVNSCKRPAILSQVQDILKTIKQDNGVFALRLSGSQHGFIERNHLLTVLSSFKDTPEIIFGNRDELLHVAGNSDTEEAVKKTFPNSRLLVLTVGKEGTIVRFEGEILLIPAIPSGSVVDTTGAGDSYMGIMLAVLFSIPYARWTQEHVKVCAQTGAVAASLVIQSMRSRLTKDQIDSVRKFYHSRLSQGKSMSL